MKNKKGFTLVELLVVIAIIGILSSVAVVNLNSARDKAKRAAVLASLSGLAPVIQLCLDSGSTANLNNTLLNDGSATGVNVCSITTTVGTNWPKINQHGYNYNNLTIDASPTAGTWSFGANSDGSLANINCTQAGCN